MNGPGFHPKCRAEKDGSKIYSRAAEMLDSPLTEW